MLKFNINVLYIFWWTGFFPIEIFAITIFQRTKHKKVFLSTPRLVWSVKYAQKFSIF